MRRVRSWHFYVSGAMGGLVGFGLMEAVRRAVPGTGPHGEIYALACQFAAFGLAVGAALGVTEGLLQRRLGRSVYGLLVGAVLGVIGGFVGGGAGQAVFGLLPTPKPPEPPGNDFAIVLDASSSMQQGQHFLFLQVEQANDPKGLRKQAARHLVDRLATRDRVAIIEFSDQAEVLQPLTGLGSGRESVRRAIERVQGDKGGTNLTAGLAAGIGELKQHAKADRSRHLIFLTDGVGAFSPEVMRPATEGRIRIYTIGLGPGVERSLLEGAIAQPTGGRYFPVSDAEKLWPAFDAIYKEVIRDDMAGSHQEASGDPTLRWILRVVSWGLMGLMIGLGQGIRENTWEDLWVCSLGGALGGLMGGALFEPVVDAFQANAGLLERWVALLKPLVGTLRASNDLLGRGVADIVVGACIGGSMRLAQSYLVEQRAEPRTTLLAILPERSTGLVAPAGGNRALTPASGASLRGLALRLKRSVEDGRGQTPLRTTPTPSGASPNVAASPSAPDPEARRKPLSFYESRYAGDRARAMALAFRSGHHSIAEIAAHFGVPPARVERAVEMHAAGGER